MDFALVSPLSNVALQFLPGRDTDAIDRLNTYVTPMFLALAAVLMASKQWLAQPLQCFIPARYNLFEAEYIEKYCFVNGTYFIPMSSEIPTSIQEREDAKLSYYQWIPLMLSLQALLSAAPLSVWRILSPKSGVNLKHCVRQANSLVELHGENRAKKLDELASYINDTLSLQSSYRKQQAGKRDKLVKSLLCWMPFVGRKYGNFLPGFYLAFKVLLLLVAVFQLVIFNAFLSTSGYFYAFEFMRQFQADYDWRTTGLFPRVTLCDFTIYVLGNQQRHTVQCVLSVNFLAEKIYVFLWFWTLAVLLLTAANLAIWIERLSFDRAQRVFVSSYLHSGVDYQPISKEHEGLDRFVRKYLCKDGVFLLRLIAFNVGIATTASLVTRLWSRFLVSNRSLSNTWTHKVDNVSENTPFADRAV